MAGLIEGKPKLLTPYDQFTLSTWMVKTCMAYDAAREPQLIPSLLGGHRLYALGYPPLISQVLVGHDADHIPMGEMLHGRESS